MRHAWVVLTAIVVALTAGCSGSVTAPSPSPSAAEEVCAPGERSPGCLTDITGEDIARREYPEATAAAWVGGALWTANESGLLTRWDVRDGRYVQYYVPDGSVIRSLTAAGDQLVAGVDGGVIWILAADVWRSERACERGPAASIAWDGARRVWCACPGEGLVVVSISGDSASRQLILFADEARDAVLSISAVAYESDAARVWVASRHGDLLSYDTRDGQWSDYVTMRGGLAVHDLLAEADGSVWLATSTGIRVYRDGTVLTCSTDLAASGTRVLSLARAADGTLWVTGQDRIWRVNNCDVPVVYADSDNPVLVDRHRLVVLDEADTPWFIGRRGKVRFDGLTWTAIDADVRRQVSFVPVESPIEVTVPPHKFPSPTQSYSLWLQTWPRPAGDNGRGMHFLQTSDFDAIEAQRQVNRLRALGVRWATVLYRDHAHLVRIAPIFQAAGIMAVWRPFVRPYETYNSWTVDITFLRSRGIAPYIQLYNEPSLEDEWEGGHVPPSQPIYLAHLLPAVQEVYEAGGYVGLQFLDPDWLRSALKAIKAAEMDYVFARTFFVPHLYGLNHPPDYTEDRHGVLGFREFAAVFQEEIGFVPAMIVGEGGWRLGEQQDDRFPAISEELHRDYHLAVFDWFRTRQLSDGAALPEYLLAFCVWLVSDPVDPAAWFDSTSGDRRLTIEAVTDTMHQE